MEDNVDLLNVFDDFYHAANSQTSHDHCLDAFVSLGVPIEQYNDLRRWHHEEVEHIPAV